MRQRRRRGRVSIECCSLLFNASPFFPLSPPSHPIHEPLLRRRRGLGHRRAQPPRSRAAQRRGLVLVLVDATRCEVASAPAARVDAHLEELHLGKGPEARFVGAAAFSQRDLKAVLALEKRQRKRERKRNETKQPRRSERVLIFLLHFDFLLCFLFSTSFFVLLFTATSTTTTPPSPPPRPPPSGRRRRPSASRTAAAAPPPFAAA